MSPDRIRLQRSEATERPGLYGLVWQSGHAVAGPILGESANAVTRRLGELRGYLEPGTEAGFDSDVYSGNPREARGLPTAPSTSPASSARCPPG